MGEVRTALHAWYREHGFATWEPTEQVQLALQLIREDHTEDKLAGILFLQEILLPSGRLHHCSLLPAFADLFECGHLADWNAVDWFCVKVLGPLVERDGEPCARAIGEWRTASTLWQRRASAVAFVNLVKRGELFPGFFRIVMASCEVLVGDPERLPDGVGDVDSRPPRCRRGVEQSISELGGRRPGKRDAKRLHLYPCRSPRCGPVAGFYRSLVAPRNQGLL